jgi:hypothetical protein
VKILFDLNVLLDVAYRPQRYPHSGQLYHRVVATRQHQGTFPACGYTTLYYLLRRNLPTARDARDTLLEWHQRLTLLPFTEPMALAAHRLSLPDFEDACVAITALEGHCTVIVTRNIADFQASPIPAQTPEALLAQLGPAIL